LVASAGLEMLGSSVLLRSLAVSSKWRGKGVARELVTRLEDIARVGPTRSLAADNDCATIF
jgi:amino-acid N-acetyltransferase